MVAHRLLAPPRQGGIVEVEPVLDHAPQIGFDGELVLRRRGHDARGADGAVVVESYRWKSSPRGASVGRCRPRPGASPRGRRVGRLVGGHQAECLVTGEHQLDTADHDAPERVGAPGPESGRAAASRASRGSAAAFSAYRASGPVR